MIKIKRVYEEISPDDGFRILVDLLWPRGLAKEKAKIDIWLKEAAPSGGLRKWFGHYPEKWNEFRKRYRHELEIKNKELYLIAEKAENGNITLLYAAKDELHNNAVVLKEFIEKLVQ